MKRKILLVGLFLVLIITVAGCGGGEEKILPKISQDAIDMAIGVITDSEYVPDAAVLVKDKTISMSVVISPLVSHRAKDIGDNFVRLLGTFTAANDSNLDPPSNDSHGSIYDYYDLLINVGTGSNNIFVSGGKARGAMNIRWE